MIQQIFLQHRGDINQIDSVYPNVMRKHSKGLYADPPPGAKSVCRTQRIIRICRVVPLMISRTATRIESTQTRQPADIILAQIQLNNLQITLMLKKPPLMCYLSHVYNVSGTYTHNTTHIW